MKRNIFKWLKRGAIALICLILAAIAAIYGISSYQLNRSHPVTELPKLTLANNPDVLARGGHIATSIGMCTECHGGDLGGKVIADAGPLGIVAAPNLTSGKGGIGATYTNDDWVRAIRHGVRRDGSSLLIMSSESFVHMTKEDLTAVISYLKQLTPVDRDVPKSHLRYLGRTLLVTGELDVLSAEKTPNLPLVKTINQKPSIEYGMYLATIGNCRGCHGADLSGGEVHGPPGTPPAANLTPTGIGTWSEADFVRTLRTGKRPNGKDLHPSMPWPQAALMTDDELHAIWLYMRSVPPKPIVDNS
ncbi:c-type cytochrome [Spirosoma montaniterrae]|uniref:Cytochrome c domain-containing protein n=1 Tax=Spirosoma montaniterrae TaxID=1178516 RepID=A0A1P9WYN0_9BACT|nr:cytochrome c [Spirosoma montaniterrae]AQG80486.1 hypothetical protein AWR27_14835 [Spirosoma montaniterrae]